MFKCHMPPYPVTGPAGSGARCWPGTRSRCWTCAAKASSRAAIRSSPRRSRWASLRPWRPSGCPGPMSPSCCTATGRRRGGGGPRLRQLGYPRSRCSRAALTAGRPPAASCSGRQRAEQGVRRTRRGRRARRRCPPEVAALLGGTTPPVVVVDARRFDEYVTMSIPTATSVPGAELVLRVAACARPRHNGHRELRRPDQVHHRRAVADQRRAAQPGRRAAQRDHRLDPGRA